MNIALDLIAVAVGYKVFADASKEKNGLKEGGRLIGVFIITLALCVIAYTMIAAYSLCSVMGGGACPLWKG